MESSPLISTKANTLFALQNLLKASRIEEMYILYVGDYRNNPDAVCQEIKKQFNGCRIVVRSSSTGEDGLRTSNAGRYKSILDVDSSSDPAIHHAILEVIRSYEKYALVSDREQVLIQRQAINVQMSGVVFTRDLHGNRPFYLINYDDSGSTDSVTGGSGGSTIWISRDVTVPSLPSPWKELLTAVQEIEALLERMVLDIEFAIKENHEVILFQVRPLAASYRQERVLDDRAFFACRQQIKSDYLACQNIFTKKPMMLSDMAFWNPSEIIGTNPRTLDYCLYREIITAHEWNRGIRELGFRALDEELMVRIGNKPYISLDYSFYSLIPASVPEELAGRLVDFYSQKLRSNLTAHDKIEFEIVYTSYDFMTEKNSEILLENHFSQADRQTLLDGLRDLTEQAIRNHETILKRDLALLSELNKKQKETAAHLASGYPHHDLLIADLLSLLELLKTNGTRPFARQARMAFMARAFLRTLTECKAFTNSEMDSFMQTISTVSSEFESDFAAYSSGHFSAETFNEKYGHLRSGTYDIRTDRYDKMNFRPLSTKRRKNDSDKSYQPDPVRLQKELDRIGLSVSPQELLHFTVTSIEQREYFKFEFTKSLSLILEMIIRLGEMTNLKRHDLSWIDLQDLRSLPKGLSAEELKSSLSDRLQKRHDDYGIYLEMLLPEVIVDGTSLDVIPVYEARPNFITSKKVEGEVIFLDEESDADLTDKIVAVPKADPGYEWVFTKGIKGFITKYGGAASHMAIRCAEFEIPAAIGCGEKIYSEISGMNYLKLDCGAGKIEEGIQYRNLSALITQREGVNQYGDPTDILETAYIRFYELLGFIPKTVSNNTKDISMVFSKQRDLLIVVGGGALDPKWYDHPHNEALQPHRDATEEKLIRYCVAKGIPIIATCRGMQYINVLYGGGLHYHPTLKAERPRGKDHPVKLLKENQTIQVNNYHEDVIFANELAPCFEPLALDEENNVIEAYGSDKMKILAIQWHPERKFETHGGYEETRRMIIDFIQRMIH
jgi:gamma-glutamyl-gamma-aminobutyrate hydrolase PuuD/phosphohistidine swiveling domain-containing protein